MDSHRASIAVAINAQGVHVLPSMELMACPNLAVPMDVMQHVVRVESSYNPYAIGVVGGRLQRQPASLPEALATVRMLESRGFNFSVGLAQVNRYNLTRYGLASYEQAFQSCPNLQAGSRILADCHTRSGGDWGKAFSCYYSGDFVTGYRHGYVQKVIASMAAAPATATTFPAAIEVVGRAGRRRVPITRYPVRTTTPLVSRRVSAITSQADPATPVESRPDAGATATATAPPQAPAASDGTASVTRTVAVLDGTGRPPRLMPTAAPSTVPDVSRPAIDDAFVF